MVLVLGGALGAIVLSEEVDLPRGPRVASACTQPWAGIPDPIAPERLRPSKIVIQPWKGRHHVYAEFTLPPKGYLINDQFRLALEPLGDFCGGVSTQKIPGEQKGVAIARLRTRTALWLIAQGKLGALYQPENWQLEILPLNHLMTSKTPIATSASIPTTTLNSRPNSQ